jgi:hypothetical protein
MVARSAAALVGIVINGGATSVPAHADPLVVPSPNPIIGALQVTVTTDAIVLPPPKSGP